MSFLAPLFLLGALGVAAPIVLHLIRRTSREKLPFSSLMFLQPSPPRVTRSSRLENLWLLLLRCLLLILLALGFARPFLARPVADSPSSTPGQRLLLLVDTSASMRRDHLWAEARSRTEQLLRRAKPADTVAVYAFDRAARPLLTFEEWKATPPENRAALALQRLASASPGWGGTHLGSSLLSAVDAIQETDKGGTATDFAGPKRIVVLTDLQEGAHLEGLQGYEWPRGLTVEVDPLKARRSANAGLQAVPEAGDTPGPAGAGGLKVRVNNAADSKKEQFQIGWLRRGEGAAAPTPVEVYVPRGQSRIVTMPRPPAGIGAGPLRLTGDDEEFDNLLHTVVARPERIRVLYLGDEDPRDPAQPLYYLRRAFQETRQKAVELTVRRLEGPVSAAELGSAALVIATGPLSGESLSAARRFLDTGKPVLLALGSTATASTAAGLTGLGTVPAEEAAPGGYALLGQIDFAHPLFAPFADPRFSDFTKIHFWKHRRVDATGWKNARVLARFDEGDPALLEVPAGRGNLFVLTSGWQPADSQLALSSKFVPLLYSLLDLGGPVNSSTAQHTVGDRVLLTGTNRTEQISVRKPDGTEVTVNAGEVFAGTDLPGIYRVGSGSSAWEFAVNLDPAESRTAPLAVDELEQLRLPLTSAAPMSARLAERQQRHLEATELEQRQKLWRWLIAAALLVVLLETWVAGWLTRRHQPAPVGA